MPDKGSCKNTASHCSSILLLVSTAAAAAALLRHPAAHAPRPAAAEGRGDREVNVLLALQAHQEGGDAADLPAHADVALADQDACVMDGLGEAQPEDLGLQAPLHDLRRGQAQHVPM